LNHGLVFPIFVSQTDGITGISHHTLLWIKVYTLKTPSYRRGSKRNTIIRLRKRRILARRVDKHVIISKEPSMINLVSHHTSKMNKEKRNNYTLFKSNQKKNKKMSGTSTCLSIMTLILNGLNSSIKR
jgi:hypothetical protein